MKLAGFLASMFITAALLGPCRLQACPLCAEAVSSSNTQNADQEQSDFPTAMNQSILFMVSVPYLAFGLVGVLIYRGCKKNAAHFQQMQRDSLPQQGNA